MTKTDATQTVSDDHISAGGVGAAIWPAKPSTTPPRPKSPKRSRQRASEPHTSDATASPANEVSKTKRHAPGTSSNGRQTRSETHSCLAASDGQSGHETQCSPAVATIRELWRRRQSWHRAEKSLTLQAFAICRRYSGGDKEEAAKLLAEVKAGTSSNDAVVISCIPLLTARNSLAAQRKPIEKELAKLAQSLPVAAWVESIRGFGFLSLAALVGECGDIGSYKSASAVWKRMGLAVINGERQRRVAGVDALEHGYSPERRAIAWNIGVSIMRAQKPDDALRAYYDAEKERQLARELTKGHAHNRACRHMTKRLLAELYGEWRR